MCAHNRPLWKRAMTISPRDGGVTTRHHSRAAPTYGYEGPTAQHYSSIARAPCAPTVRAGTVAFWSFTLMSPYVASLFCSLKMVATVGHSFWCAKITNTRRLSSAFGKSALDTAPVLYRGPPILLYPCYNARVLRRIVWGGLHCTLRSTSDCGCR